METIGKIITGFFTGNKRRISRLFLLFLFMPTINFAQSKADCIILNDLMKIYWEDLMKSTRLLTQNDWMLISDDKNVDLIVDGDKVNYHLVVWSRSQGIVEDYLYLYYYEGLFNYVEWITNQQCYAEYSNQLKRQFRNFNEEKSGNTTKTIFSSSEEYQIVLTERKGSHQMLNDYFISIYNKKEIDSLVSIQREFHQSEQLIINQKREEIENAFRDVEILVSKENFEEALLIIEKLPLDIPEYRTEIQSKRDQLQKSIREKKIKVLLEEGEALFAERSLKSARQKYQDVLLLDVNHDKASSRIKQIDEMQEVLSLRSVTIYDYRTLNPDAYRTFQQKMLGDINRIIDEAPQGSLDYTFTLFFDTLGVNKSFFEIRNSTVGHIEKSLTQMATNNSMQPTYKDNILVKSSAVIDVRINWETYPFKIKKKQNRVKVRSSSKLYSEKEIVEQFLNQEDMPTGRYFFDMKIKERGGRDYVDISLEKYKVVGPEAFFYSMLLPGAGTVAATQGKKGGWAMASFLIVGGGSLTAFLFHRDMNKRVEAYESGELGVPEGTDIAKLKKNSNILKYTSYVGFGISGVIYIYDIFNAFAKGIKNMKKSKELRNALKKEPTEIMNNPIVF